jgi:uncharacterized repeat protein (TIGR01451 family)
MNSPWKSIRAPRIVATLTLLLAAFAVTAFPQAGSSNMEPIDADSLIIPMDNDKQGDVGSPCGGPGFNIRAYGLAVHLLHANIPLKWSIANKATKDATDFTANVTRVRGQDCPGVATQLNVPFSGGPLIIADEYRVAALVVIDAFNSSTSNNDDVRVYEADSGFVAPIRYTLTHKPFVAVGPDGGGFGGSVYQDLLDAAGLVENTHYGLVANNIFQTNSCVTLAAQAHASNDAITFIGTYRSFAEAGGNLLLQCHSVDVFENAAAPNGRFQTTLGWTVFGTSGGQVNGTITDFPNPAMPFNQFVGELADQEGQVSEYQLAASSVFQNGTLISAKNNSAGNTNKYVATVSHIGNASAGGSVFELGGHDYDRTDATNTEIGRANGNRMALNTLLQPAFRPGCGLAINSTKAFKSVKMFNDINGNTLPNFGDTVEWTLRYINDGNITVTNFQITDPLDARLGYVPGSLTAVATGAGTTVTANVSYLPNTNINMLVPASSQLAPGGMITVKFRTIVQGFGEIPNQGAGTGTGINTPVKTDTTDSTTTGNVAGYTIACPGGCLSQAGYQTGSNEDPTKIDLGTLPSAAPATVSGKVLDENGRGLRGVNVVLQNAGTGQVRTAVTNTFGNFSFLEVETAQLYVVSVFSKRYTFVNESIAFELNDDLAGLTFNVAPADQPGEVIKMVEPTGKIHRKLDR